MAWGQVPAPSPVQVTTLVPASWRAHVQVSATLQAAEYATLSPALGGIVTGVMFRSGQSVSAGQPLVQLQNGPNVAQLVLDEDKYAQAERDYVRTRKLMAIAGSSQSALDQSATNAEEAKAQISLDEANLSQLQIIAPFAGTLGIRDIDPGDYLTAGQTVVSLTAPGPLRVFFSVPQTEAAGIVPGENFSLEAPGGNRTPTAVQGKVVAVSPGQDPNTDARAVEGRVAENPELLPNMYGVVDIATGVPMPAFAVPSAALNDSTLGPFVFVLVPSGKAYTLSTVYVTIYGGAGDTDWISPSGLQPGQKIVALGGFQLSDGASVTPAPP